MDYAKSTKPAFNEMRGFWILKSVLSFWIQLQFKNKFITSVFHLLLRLNQS